MFFNEWLYQVIEIRKHNILKWLCYQSFQLSYIVKFLSKILWSYFKIMENQQNFKTPLSWNFRDQCCPVLGIKQTMKISEMSSLKWKRTPRYLVGCIVDLNIKYISHLRKNTQLYLNIRRSRRRFKMYLLNSGSSVGCAIFLWYLWW